MAVKLAKPVHRVLQRTKATNKGRVEIPDKTGFIPQGAKEVIVSLLPSEEIQFRVKRTKQQYRAPLSFIMMVAQAMTWCDEQNEKHRQYKLKKDAGYKRLRKPKKVYHPQVASALRRLYNAVA